MDLVLGELIEKLQKIEKAVTAEAEIEIIPVDSREGICQGEIYDILADLDNKVAVIRLL